MPNPTREQRSRASWAGRLLLAALARIPRAVASRAFGRLADARIPRRLRAPLIGGFARMVGARTEESERPPAAHATLNAFFTRRLAPGARSWPADGAVAASPVDGVLTRLGVVEDGRLVQAKGRRYSAAALLDSAEAAARFHGGLYATIYLAPRHYHRIHAPAAGLLRSASYVPGGLFPVNAAAVAEIPDLLATNERVVCSFAGDAGRLALVAVGAYNVGRISTTFDPGWGGGEGGWVTNRRPPSDRRRVYRPPLAVARGEEVMAFHLGSCVIVLFERGAYEWVPGLAPGREIRLGEALARPPRRPGRDPTEY